MTPLAKFCADQLTIPVRRRTLEDNAGVLKYITDAHCFDVTAVYEPALVLMRRLRDEGSFGPPSLQFLPAPVTWIEFQETKKCRMAYLLRNIGGMMQASFDLICQVTSHRHHAEITMQVSPLDIGRGVAEFNECLQIERHIAAQGLLDRAPINLEQAADLHLLPYVFLAMINTPRVIGQRTHMPHAGLQRRLAAARGMVGKFPLRAWTELVLEVTPPKADDGAPQDVRLTGGRALHFVRSHLRVRLGRLELVSAHWRGDPALGLKRSRYKIVPPADGNWPSFTP